MSDPDIRRWLRHQTRGEVGLVPFPIVREGAKAIRTALDREAKAGRRLIVADALSDADLRALGEAVAGDRLVTGGSGIAMGLPENFIRRGLIEGRNASFPGFSGPGVALSGSCSTQSLRQVAVYAKDHPVFELLPDKVMNGTQGIAEVTCWAMDHLDRRPMVYSSADAHSVRAAQERHGREAVAGAIEAIMAGVAKALLAARINRLVVGGGETSGAVVSALGISQLRIGPEIDPGVPALATDGNTLGLVLKSGNFGTDDFYAKAFKALETPRL
jgi:uncharacterized protein YgbK (DUF1537 family)